MVAKTSVLIVDGDESTRRSLTRMFQDEGYEMAAVATGREAMALALDRRFDSALIDISLPDMRGAELLGSLKGVQPDMVVIMITAVASLQMAVSALIQGAAAYLIKPLSTDEVLLTVREAIEKQQLTMENRRLERKMVEYEELDKLKTSLLSTVSHELRTPLAIIKGYSTMLLDSDHRLPEEERRQHVGSIDHATDRLTELVDHLLDMSRLDAGLLKLEKLPASISRLINEAVAEAQLTAPAGAVVSRVKDGLPRVSVDARRIRQVLDNLIDNALKYSDGEISVTVDAAQSGAEMCISVADRGIGIAAEDIDRVFERMYRAEQRLAQGQEGLGLGLSVCKGVVEAHGGRIWAESQPGQGSTFYFTLPLTA